MYNDYGVFKLARNSFLAMTLAEPFTFSIPAIGVVSNSDMEKIISAYWMPWLRKVYVYCKLFGLCPYYFEKRREIKGHRLPVVPDMDKGFITTIINEDTHRTEYKWYWSHTTTTQYEKNMFWIVTEDAPDAYGRINSQMRSLLEDYRAMVKLRTSQNICATQRARPVHLIEHVPEKFGGTSDDLSHLNANFGAAAGITKARREMQKQNEVRIRTEELYKQLADVQRKNSELNTIQQTLWTDTPGTLLEEMDAGFNNRVVVMRPNFRYVQAAKPELVGDYQAASSAFDMKAAAVWDFAMELLTPTGSSRTQNVQGSERFENDRIKENTSFFLAVVKPALVEAYREQFTQAMEEARNYRVTTLKGDPNLVPFLYPELDVQVDMSSSTVSTYDHMRQMWYDGIISKETFGKHVFRNSNIPQEQMEMFGFPDGVPKELLIKGFGEGEKAAAKPPKKKAKSSN